MGILNNIFKIASEEAGNTKVKDVRIGLGYTVVLLDNNQAGLAYTIRDDFIEGCSVFHGSQPLSGKNAQELLCFLKSDQSIERAVGLATANALTNHEKKGISPGDVLQNIEIKSTDQIGMVGLFNPLIKPLKKKEGRL